MAKRFPQSMLTYVKVVQAQPLIACPTSEHGVTVEEHARYAGLQAALAWVLQIFDGSPVDGIGLERMRIAGIESRPVLLTKKHTKPYFAQLLANMIARLESQWNFDPGNGWEQVNGKGVPANEAYGFYEALTDLDEEFVFASIPNLDQKAPPPEDPGNKILALESRLAAQELRMKNIESMARTLERQTIVNWLRGPHQGSDTEAWKGSIRPLYDELADLIARGV